jgi:hypothetical protein
MARGRQAVAPAYENAGGFERPGARRAARSVGYIDVNGAVLIPAIYRSAQEFHGDLAIVTPVFGSIPSG